MSVIIHIPPWYSAEFNKSHILSAKRYQIFGIYFLLSSSVPVANRDLYSLRWANDKNHLNIKILSVREFLESISMPASHFNCNRV